MPKQAFVSHIGEEAAVAAGLKKALTIDFLGFLDVFVSSDGESISAGDHWLDSIAASLRASSILIVLCSPTSIRRPWVNFEAGAAWMREIPIIPLCHAGLAPSDLPMPLSSRHGIELTDPQGLRRLYERIADLLEGTVPPRSFDDLAHVLAETQATIRVRASDTDDLQRDRAIKQRLVDSLAKSTWRSLDWVAREAGLSEEVAADYLRANVEVRFSRGKSGATIVGLRSNVE